MERTVAQVSKVAELLGAISEATREQTAEIEQVSKAVSHLDQVTQQNATLVRSQRLRGQREPTGTAALALGADVFKLS